MLNFFWESHWNHTTNTKWNWKWVRPEGHKLDRFCSVWISFIFNTQYRCGIVSSLDSGSSALQTPTHKIGYTSMEFTSPWQMIIMANPSSTLTCASNSMMWATLFQPNPTNLRSYSGQSCLTTTYGSKSASHSTRYGVVAVRHLAKLVGACPFVQTWYLEQT